MGQGKRIISWIKKRLFGKKANRLLKKKTKYAAPTAVLNNLEADQNNVSESFSDVSLTKFLPPEVIESSDSTSSLSQKKCTSLYSEYEAQENGLPFHLSHSNLELESVEYRSYHTNQGLTPIVEVHANVITKSRASSMLYDVSSHQEKSCQTLPTMRQGGLKQNVRRGKIPKEVKPLASIAEEPATSGISEMSTSVVGVASIKKKDIHRLKKTAKPLWLLKMEKAMGDALEESTTANEENNNRFTSKKKVACILHSVPQPESGDQKNENAGEQATGHSQDSIGEQVKIPSGRGNNNVAPTDGLEKVHLKVKREEGQENGKKYKKTYISSRKEDVADEFKKCQSHIVIGGWGTNTSGERYLVRATGSEEEGEGEYFASGEEDEPALKTSHEACDALDDDLAENDFSLCCLSDDNHSTSLDADCLGYPAVDVGGPSINTRPDEVSGSFAFCDRSVYSVHEVEENDFHLSCVSDDNRSASGSGASDEISTTASEDPTCHANDDSSNENSSHAGDSGLFDADPLSDHECDSSSESMEFLGTGISDDSWDDGNEAEFAFCLTSYERGFKACHPSDHHSEKVGPDLMSSKSTVGQESLTENPKEGAVAAERELPEKWVDTRKFPVMTDEEVLYDRKDLNLFYRRKYFIYMSDRTRDLSYNLEEDHIVCNTEEHRREMQELLREEEAQAMQEWKEKKLKDESDAKRRWMVEKLELEKRWFKMNEKNRDLWKQEQQQNVRKWRVKLMKGEKRWQELEARWEEEELQYEKMLKDDKMEAENKRDGQSLDSLHPIPRPPPRDPSEETSSSTVGGSSNSSSCRRRLYRRQKPNNSEENTMFESVAQSTHQVSKTEISSANTGGYMRMPPIDLTGPNRITGTLDQYSSETGTDVGQFQPVQPADPKPPTLLNRRGFRRSKGKKNIVANEQGSSLPPLKDCPIICRPLDLNDIPLIAPQPPEGPRPMYTFPKRSERYLHNINERTSQTPEGNNLTVRTPQAPEGPRPNYNPSKRGECYLQKEKTSQPPKEGGDLPDLRTPKGPRQKYNLPKRSKRYLAT